METNQSVDVAALKAQLEAAEAALVTARANRDAIRANVEQAFAALRLALGKTTRTFSPETRARMSQSHKDRWAKRREAEKSATPVPKSRRAPAATPA